MYDDCLRRTAEAGFTPYEISNFALPGRECRHNLEYWTGGEYAAYGPGAVGMVLTPPEGALSPALPTPKGEEVVAIRYTNLKHPERYCGAVESGAHPAYDVEGLTDAELRTERIMLGLRLDAGIRETLDARAVTLLRGRGWLEETEGRVRLTPEGRHFHSEVAAELI